MSGVEEKTPGQRLYEYKNPPFLRVVLYEGRRFATEQDVMLMKNEAHTPWRFLTQYYKDSWEVSAKGHHIFSEERV